MFRETGSHSVVRIADHNARFKRAVQRIQLTLFLAIGITVLAFGPIDMPGEALLLALEAGLFGAAVGYAFGTRRRQFLQVKGTGPRISQSCRQTHGEVIYSSYDVLDNPFDFQPVYVSGVLYRALRFAPFISDSAAIPPDTKEGRWLFQTEDSYGRPTFLDEPGLIGMAHFCKRLVKDEPIEQFIEHVLALRLQTRLARASQRPIR